MNQLQQLLIVLGVLTLLPVAVKLLWKTYLFPLGAVIVATRLFWPKWAAVHVGYCIALYAGSILFFTSAWAIRGILKRRREQEWLRQVFATTKPLYELPEEYVSR